MPTHAPHARLPPACAANAFLKRALGADVSARLVGVKDMPKGASRLSLDFSSLLGPLFSMWLLQVRLRGLLLWHVAAAGARLQARTLGCRDAGSGGHAAGMQESRSRSFAPTATRLLRLLQPCCLPHGAHPVLALCALKGQAHRLEYLQLYLASLAVPQCS